MLSHYSLMRCKLVTFTLWLLSYLKLKKKWNRYRFTYIWREAMLGKLKRPCWLNTMTDSSNETQFSSEWTVWNETQTKQNITLYESLSAARLRSEPPAGFCVVIWALTHLWVFRAPVFAVQRAAPLPRAGSGCSTTAAHQMSASAAHFGGTPVWSRIRSRPTLCGVELLLALHSGGFVYSG